MVDKHSPLCRNNDLMTRRRMLAVRVPLRKRGGARDNRCTASINVPQRIFRFSREFSERKIHFRAKT